MPRLLALSLVAALMLSSVAQAGSVLVDGGSKPGFFGRQVNKFREFRIAKAQVKALVAPSPELQRTYDQTFMQGRPAGNWALAFMGIGGGATTTNIIQEGVVHGLTGNPGPPLMLILGAVPYFARRSARHADARVAVLGEALRDPTLRGDIAHGAIAYYGRHASAQQGEDERALVNAQVSLSRLSEKIKARGEVLNLETVQRELSLSDAR